VNAVSEQDQLSDCGRKAMTRYGLLIRTEASRTAGGIGLGHAMRCLALAKSWLSRGGDVSVLAIDLPSDVEKSYVRAGAAVVRLPPATRCGSRQDADLTQGMLNRLGSAWLVLDGYEFRAEYQEVVAGPAGVLVIDDHGHAGRYRAQVILDENAGVEPGVYAERPFDSILLLGPRFALIAPEFRSVARRRRQGPIRRIVVMLGGAPNKQVTNVAAALGAELVSHGFEVRTVGGTPPADCGLEWLSSVPTVAEVMRDADLCIAAAGVTAWECCCAGLPSLLFAAAPNQDAVAEAAANAGAAINLGRLSHLDSREIVTKVRELAGDRDALLSMSRAGLSLIDGAGADRVLDEMWPRLHLRPVRRGDALLLWKWSNDPTVQRASFSANALSWEHHVHWLDDRLSDPTTRLFLAMTSDDRSLGQVRFDRDGAEARISISLDPAARGTGLGPPAIRLGVSAILEAWPDVSRVVALVKVGNAPSMGAFRSAGFHQLHEVEVNHHRAWVYELRRDEVGLRR